MNRSKWMKPLIQIVSAAVLTSTLSAGISFLIIAGNDSWKQSHKPSHASMSAQVSNNKLDIVLASAPVRPKSSATSSIQQAVKDAIQALSQHEPFTSWKYANTSIQPLGPGTHGWIIHITSQKNKSLGYLIIHATENGDYSLTEYGTGENYPFAQHTLDNALASLDLNDQKSVIITPYYVQPLLTVWKLEHESDVQWIEAQSGEVLPTQNDQWMKMAPFVTAKLSTSGGMTTDHVLFQTEDCSLTAQAPSKLQSFDPYDQIGWMDETRRVEGETAQRLLKQWQPFKGSKQLVYVQRVESSGTFDTAMNFPYAVVGDQVWKDSSKSAAEANIRYIAVQPTGEASVRYVSEKSILQQGYLSPVRPLVP
ncbi:hypothetical protein [Paenibacillus marinisediminis]